MTLLLAALFVLGAGGAVAYSAATGEHVACATTTALGTTVSGPALNAAVPDTVLSVCVTATDQTVPGPTTTETVTSTVATTTPSTTSSSAAPLFDGQASGMTAIDSVGGPGHQTQSPVVWSCLCYIQGNVKLIPDATYGKAYQYTTNDASTNGWYDPGALKGATELTKARSAPYTGHWDWFRFAIKVPASWQQTTWNVMFEPNFPEITSPPVAIRLSPRAADGSYAWTRSKFVASWWDMATNVSTTSGGTSYAAKDYWIQPLEPDQWVEFVWGIDYETNLTGAFKVYTRPPGGLWTLKASAAGINTYQMQTSSPNDVQMLYFGDEPSNGWPSVLPSNTVLMQGYRRFAAEQDALAAP